MEGITIEGLDIFDVLKFMKAKQSKFLSEMLSNIEETVPEEYYAEVRKYVLDGMNDYTRSVLRTFFGDVEGLIIR